MFSSGASGWAEIPRWIPPRLSLDPADEMHELLRSIAALGTHRRTALTLRAAGYSYREIQ